MDQTNKSKEAGQDTANTDANEKSNKAPKPIEYTEIYAWGGNTFIYLHLDRKHPKYRHKFHTI